MSLYEAFKTGGVKLSKNNFTMIKEPLLLTNVTEDLVKLQVREYIEKLGACDCETCYLNACALALNDLEPKYVTTKEGALFSELTATEVNNQTHILVAVTKAVEQVIEFPHH
ncbi:MAG: Late competence development protein ComFB [Oscillospiraceae bacterium]|jgi:competence protein ComFB|nr:Late competence development protein ComFB [Oscillospiraceae bacterium]